MQSAYQVRGAGHAAFAVPGGPARRPLVRLLLLSAGTLRNTIVLYGRFIFVKRNNTVLHARLVMGDYHVLVPLWLNFVALNIICVDGCDPAASWFVFATDEVKKDDYKFYEFGMCGAFAWN